MMGDALNNDEGARMISQFSTNNDTQTRRTAVFCPTSSMDHITDGSVSLGRLSDIFRYKKALEDTLSLTK